MSRGALAAALLATCALSLVALSALSARARQRRSLDTPTVLAVVRVLPAPDLAIAGGSRHLRSLSLEEPEAAVADLPASLDADPAGGAISPPRAFHRSIVVSPRLAP